MRVNIYAEEMTDRIEIVGKEIDGHTYTGLRLYLELPVTHNGENVRGPFMHRPGDDDSAAITFWGKRDLRVVLRKMSDALAAHYNQPTAQCNLAPAGWICTRLGGHSGPCAAQRVVVHDLRQSIGEALSAKLYELTDNGQQSFDACDAYNIDMLLDEVMPLIDANRNADHSPSQSPPNGSKVEHPKRAVQFRVDIGADTPRDLATTLLDLATRVDRNELGAHSVSGGYNSGYEHWLIVADRPTHDEYVEQLNVYLAGRREA